MSLADFGTLGTAVSVPTVDILGLPLPLIDHDVALQLVMSKFGVAPVSLYFINAHTATLARRCGEYRRVLEAGNVLLNDGVALSVAARLKGQRFPADLPGNVIVPQILQAACMPRPLRLFLLGGLEDTVVKAAARVRECFGNVEIVGTHHGYFTPEQEPSLVSAIAATEPHLVLVGMGNPKQELFIHQYRDELGKGILAGVGGLIDIWGGRIRDYPKWATRWRLHWLCRLRQEPIRLARRYFIEVPRLWLAVWRDSRRNVVNE